MLGSEGLRSPNRKGHGQFHKDSLDENNMDDKENLEDEDIREFVNYQPRFQYNKEKFH